MNEELKVIISADISKYKKGMKDAEKEISNFQKELNHQKQNVNNTFQSIGDGIGKAVKTGVKVAVGALASLTGALAGIGISAIKSYADYEQLVGGVNKLFGDSSNTIMKYAQDAYKNAGISANTYMEQITSFSASLISSLGGDTAKAAEIGNMAINDMADNANTFGTSIESIQNAYQGFAKQNYTMLDNLKLGYGGTKEEMQRLIDKANELREAQGVTTKLTIDSYADVVQAIHTVQEEMKITGTTMNEAEGTISGSIAMMKASWENLMTGLADSNADIPQLVNNVVSSAAAVLHNIIPIAKEVIKNIPAAISEISPEAGAAMQAVVDFASAAWPVLKDAVSQAFAVISETFNFISEHQTLFAAIASAIGVVVTAIGIYNTVQALKNALDLASTASLAAVNTALWAHVAAMMAAIAPYIAIVAAIAAVIAIIVICVKHWDDIKEACAKAWNAIKEKTVDAVNAVKDKFNDMKEAISDKVNAIKEGISEKYNAMKETMSNVMQAAKDTVSEKLNNMKQAYEENGGGMKGAVAAAMEGIKGYYTAGYTFINNLTGGKLGEVVDKFKSKMDSAKSAVSSALDGIKNKFSSMLDSAKSIVSSGLDKIKSCFNFSWSLPKIKLPHFSISGSFSLNPPSIPHFSVSWYKLGGIFDSPTLFPFGNGQIGGLGEDGAEAIVPLEKNTQWLDRLATMLNEKQGGNRPIYLMVDGKVFGEVACESINDLTRMRGSIPLVFA